MMKILSIIKDKPKCYTCEPSTVIYNTARVINNLGDSKAICIGANTHIKGELLTFGHGGKIEIGDYCFIGLNTFIWSGLSIKIGNRVLISHNCNVFDNDTHPINPNERHKQFIQIITYGQPKNIDLNDEEIIIEDDVLIGANSIILKGVKIGKGSIVGAGSVVTRSVPPFTIVAGNPAKLIRELKDDER